MGYSINTIETKYKLAQHLDNSVGLKALQLVVMLNFCKCQHTFAPLRQVSGLRVGSKELQGHENCGESMRLCTGVGSSFLVANLQGGRIDIVKTQIPQHVYSV